MILWQRRRAARHFGQRVRGFQRRDNAFGAAAVVEGVQRLLIGYRDVFDAALLVQPGVFGANAGVVQTGGDRVGVGDLTVTVLQQVGAVAVQHAGRAALQAGGVLAGVDAVTGRFHADHLHLGVIEERVEQAHGVGATADTGDQAVGQTAFAFQHLLVRLAADDRLKVAYQRRVGVRTGHGADHVEGVVDVGHPVAQRLVHCVLEGAGAGGHGDDLGAQQPHAGDVVALTVNVGRAHVDHALQAEARTHGGGCHAVHAGAGLGDDPRLAHAAGQQGLADAVVDLVRAGVIQLLALEEDLRATVLLGQPFGEIQRAGAADELGVEAVQLGDKRGLGAGFVVGLLQLQHQRHQRLGHKAATKLAELTERVGFTAIIMIGHGIPPEECRQVRADSVRKKSIRWPQPVRKSDKSHGQRSSLTECPACL